MYHKLETQQAATASELDENSEVVKAAARIAGVSVQAVLAPYRRMSYLENNTQTHASGFVGISLGRVELPVMNRGVVRKDGWRAATIGEEQPATAEAIKSLVDCGAIRTDRSLEEYLRQRYRLPVKDAPTTMQPKEGE